MDRAKKFDNRQTVEFLDITVKKIEHFLVCRKHLEETMTSSYCNLQVRFSSRQNRRGGGGQDRKCSVQTGIDTRRPRYTFEIFITVLTIGESSSNYAALEYSCVCQCRSKRGGGYVKRTTFLSPPSTNYTWHHTGISSMRQQRVCDSSATFLLTTNVSVFTVLEIYF